MKIVKLEVIDVESLFEILPTGTFLLDEESSTCIMKLSDFEDFKLEIADYVKLLKYTNSI